MILKVAVAIIINSNNEILISRRSENQHQGNKWEFPGGKVEEGESVEQALSREIKEELGIEILSPQHFTDIDHEYKAVDPKQSKTVKLMVYEVKYWLGEPRGMENQPIRWVKRNALETFEFPNANKAIIKLLLRSK